MAHLRRAQILWPYAPTSAQRLQHGRLVDILADELVERQPFDPLHLENRIPVALDADALLQIAEVHGERQSGLLEMGADFLVAVAQAGGFAGEALDGPARAVGAAHLIDVGEVAGERHGQAERVGDGLAAWRSASAKLVAGDWIASL